MSTTQIFAVKGMTCAGCQAAVTRVLKRVEGVSDAVVDLQRQEATITFDPTKATADQFASVVQKAGYELCTK